jgi:hypothetical protein
MVLPEQGDDSHGKQGHLQEGEDVELYDVASQGAFQTGHLVSILPRWIVIAKMMVINIRVTKALSSGDGPFTPRRCSSGVSGPPDSMAGRLFPL